MLQRSFAKRLLYEEEHTPDRGEALSGASKDPTYGRHIICSVTVASSGASDPRSCYNFSPSSKGTEGLADSIELMSSTRILL